MGKMGICVFQIQEVILMFSLYIFDNPDPGQRALEINVRPKISRRPWVFEDDF